MADEPMERAKNLLLGAVETALRIANTRENVTVTPPFQTSQVPRSPLTPATGRLTAYDEHKRLFGHSPGHSSRGKGTKRRHSSKSHEKSPKKKIQPKWKKEAFLLRECNQVSKPTVEEKMSLAKSGLGLKQLAFDVEGDAQHIHDVIMMHYPALCQCGGYSLLRLSGSTLVEIESPDAGMTVLYLKDVLRQAKLFIAPLQRDISDEMLKVHYRFIIYYYATVLP